MELLQVLLLMILSTQCWQTGYGQLPPDILLDLNAPDNTTLDYTDEYSDLDMPVYLSDPNNTKMMTLFSTEQSNWTSIYLLIFNGTIQDDADLFFDEAQMDGRLDDHYGDLYSRTQLGPLPARLGDFSPLVFTRGMRVTGNSDDFLNETEVEIALQAIAFEAGVHPGYDPRVVCVVAEDPFNKTTACVTLYFIGYNDDSPMINYTASGNASFTEGQLDPVPIGSGSLEVTDMDHPTRYPIQSAQAAIQGFMDGNSEFLSVVYESSAFIYQFDQRTGILTITGAATADIYTQLLNNITYFNNMSEPFGTYRTIELTVNDGMFPSNQVDIIVTIVNVNDAPAVSLSGDDPVINRLSFDYTEGSGLVGVAPNITVIDTDPNAMIQRLEVSLVNPLDGDSELISLSTSDPLGLTTNNSDPHIIVLTGIAARDDYTFVLRTLSYQHTDANPGNPTTTQAREIEFFVQDDQNATNVETSVLLINIVPVNDAPILLYVSDSDQRASSVPILAGETLAMFNYTEDDPPIIFGRDIYLRDVDGNVSSATLTLTGLLDGVQDFVTVDQMLLMNGGLNMTRNRINNDTEEVITIEGEATPYNYEEVLRSLTYQNLYSTNQVTDGLRNITITTRDDGGLASSPIEAVVTVMDRNDGPGLDIGGGVGQDFTVTFVEDGSAVAIAQAHLTDIMDEEFHNISSLSLTLSATNGNLDPGETIYIRSPMVDLVPFLISPFSDISVNIAVTESVEFYENVLRYAYYYNPLDEPTILNATGSILTRVVVIRITDDNFVDPEVDPNAVFNADLGVTTTTVNVFVRIDPINDKRPRILITAQPGGCAVDSSLQAAATDSSNRRRRDLKAVSRLRKRSVVSSADQNMAPKLISSSASFTQLEHTRCLQSIKLVFNVNTSTPVIQVPKLLDQLMTFDPPELNEAEKIGVWMDYHTMVVFFKECVSLPRLQGGSGAEGRERVVNVAFESEREACSWTSPCEQGVCFHNNTGCPMTGYYQINTSCSEHNDSPTQDSNSDSLKKNDIYAQTFFVIFGSILLVFVVLVVAVVCKGRQRRNLQTALDKPSSTLPTKYTPQLTAITITPPSTPPTNGNKSSGTKNFVEEVELPNTAHCAIQTTEEAKDTPTETVPVENRPHPKGCKSNKSSKKRKAVKPVPKTSLTSDDSHEKEGLLSDESCELVSDKEGGDDDGGCVMEERLRVCVAHDTSCDQSCDRIHDNNSGQRSTTSSSKSIDHSSSSIGSSNHSDRAKRLSNSRQTTPKATNTTRQYSEH